MHFLCPTWRLQGLQDRHAGPQGLYRAAGPHLSNFSEAIKEMAPGSYIRTNKTDSSPAQGRYTHLWPLHESQLISSEMVSVDSSQKREEALLLCTHSPVGGSGGRV